MVLKRPLYLTRDAGFSCYYLSLIGKHTADIGFQRLGQPETTVRVRTMPQKADKSMKGISGVYSVTWKDQVIDGVPVSIAKINDTSYVARRSLESGRLSVLCPGSWNECPAVQSPPGKQPRRRLGPLFCEIVVSGSWLEARGS